MSREVRTPDSIVVTMPPRPGEVSVEELRGLLREEKVFKDELRALNRARLRTKDDVKRIRTQIDCIYRKIGEGSVLVELKSGRAGQVQTIAVSKGV